MRVPYEGCFEGGTSPTLLRLNCEERVRANPTTPGTYIQWPHGTGLFQPAVIISHHLACQTLTLPSIPYIGPLLAAVSTGQRGSKLGALEEPAH